MPRKGAQAREQKWAYVSGFCKPLQCSAILAFSLTRRRSLVRTQHRPLRKNPYICGKIGKEQVSEFSPETLLHHRRLGELARSACGMTEGRRRKIAVIGAAEPKYDSREVRVACFPWNKLKRLANFADYDAVISTSCPWKTRVNGTAMYYGKL